MVQKLLDNNTGSRQGNAAAIKVMALINHIDELKKYIAVNTSLRLEDLLPFINRAESLQIRPVIGKELYNELHTAYEAAETLSAPQIALLGLCQDCIANFAMLLFIPHGLTQINSAGVHQTQNQTKKPATADQIERLTASYAQSAYRALDEILEHLEENAADYPNYDAAEGKQYFVHSTRQFAKYVNIGGSRRTYIALQPIMQRIENTLIKKILGNDLYRSLRQCHAGTFQGAAEDLEYLEQLLEEIKPLIAYKTIEKGITELSLTITETGLHIYSSSSTLALTLKLPADAQRIENLRLEYQEEAQQAEKSLMDFLYAKAQENGQYTFGAYIKPQAEAETNSIDNRYYIA